MSIGKAHVGEESAVEKVLFPTLRFGRSKNGVFPGDPGAEDGAVEEVPPDDWEEYELS